MALCFCMKKKKGEQMSSSGSLPFSPGIFLVTSLAEGYTLKKSLPQKLKSRIVLMKFAVSYGQAVWTPSCVWGPRGHFLTEKQALGVLRMVG